MGAMGAPGARAGAELHVVGRLEGGRGFGGGGAVCRWRCALGPGWEVAAGAAEGQTQAAWAGPEAGASGGESVWSHPIDLRLRCTGRGGGGGGGGGEGGGRGGGWGGDKAGGSAPPPEGGVWAWPKLEFTVLRADALLGQLCFAACGVAAVPRSPGQHQVTCRTWRPNNAVSWGSEELQGYFLDLHPAPADPACIVARDGARGMQTVGVGEVFLDLGVLPTASLLDTMRMPARDLGLGTLAAKGGHGTSWEAATGLWGKDERSLDAAVAGRASREALGADPHGRDGDSEDESEGLKLVRGGRHRRLLQQGESQGVLPSSPSQRAGGLRPLRSLRTLETRGGSGVGDGASSVGSGASSTTREDRRRRVEELKAKRGARSLNRGNR